MSARARQIRLMVLSVTTVLLTLLTAKALLPGPPSALPVLNTLGGEFTLPGTRGRDVSLSDYQDRMVLLNFGFTSCPDVCPTVLARMRALLLDLEALDVEAQPLFVTLDPERDSLPTVDAYLANFHPAFVGMSGTAEQIATVAALYEVHYQREELESELGYSIAHSSHIYLIDGRGRVRAMFGGSHRLSDMVDTARQLAGERT